MFQADIDWSSKFPEYVSLEPIVIVNIFIFSK